MTDDPVEQVVLSLLWQMPWALAGVAAVVVAVVRRDGGISDVILGVFGIALFVGAAVAGRRPAGDPTSRGRSTAAPQRPWGPGA